MTTLKLYLEAVEDKKTGLPKLTAPSPSVAEQENKDEDDTIKAMNAADAANAVPVTETNAQAFARWRRLTS